MNLKVKIFADGADKAGMLEMYKNPVIAGFTTNPTLMRKAGVSDYVAFAKEMVQLIPDKPLSFEVFSDEFDEMERQALEIKSWGPNVYVKIPITNTKQESSVPLIKRLADAGVRMNITAMFTEEQNAAVTEATAGGPGAFLSIFAGRIADAGQDPLPIMRRCVEMLDPYPELELIWASPREVLNAVQADQVGCHIITMTNDLIRKLPNLGKDLTEFSLDTVKMFYNDAQSCGFAL